MIIDFVCRVNNLIDQGINGILDNKESLKVSYVLKNQEIV